MNVLRQGDDELVTVDCSDLLEKILQVLRNHNLFKISSDRHRLLIDIDAVATEVADLQVQHPLGGSERMAHSATVNFSTAFKNSFPGKVREIKDCLQRHLESVIGGDLSQFVDSLITGLQHFNKNAKQLGFTYDFVKRYEGLQKQKLSLDSNVSNSSSILKFHKLTISVQNTREFDAHLTQRLENYINNLALSESERDELREMLPGMVADDFSDFHQLKRVVDTESLGKLKKEAKILYLEYLLENIRSRGDTSDSFAVIYLQDLIRRLRLIEEYISNVDRSEGYYEVNYAGRSINYKDLFSRSEVLDALPIIPIVVGNLGETTDDKDDGAIASASLRQFIFGFKLKLGGAVQAKDGKSVFEYNLNLINPDSPEHQAEIRNNPFFGEKVLKLVFLYYFVFACLSDIAALDYNPNLELEYDPIAVFEARVLPVLRGTDEEEKKQLFRGILNGFQQRHVGLKINRLRDLLKDFLDGQTILPSRTYPLYIGVRSGILEKDINTILNGTFFNEVLQRNPKESLRYISVSPSIDSTTLCQLPVSITIEDIRYFIAEEHQNFSWEYDIQGIEALPVLWVPKEDRCRNVYKSNFQHKLVVFPYDNRCLDPNNLNSNKAFIYRFTFSLLAYICLKILLNNTPKKLFIPQLRLHVGDRNNPSPSEEFTAALSRVLSHLFKEEHLSSSQGFRIHLQLPAVKIRNGLSSLYSVLPKKFLADTSSSSQLDKLAIIVVSSRESDARRSNKNRFNRRANLVGEVISIKRLEDGLVQLETLETFSENYRIKRLYSEPPVLIDRVNNLYQQGYRHFLYIAQAPYSSTLHLTKSDEDEGLFFMSPTLIKALKGDRSDIKIYPIFFDKYYVRKRENFDYKKNAFYIQNPQELANLVEPSKKAVVFFNLFNGITVGRGGDRFYNGVISYSTLLNIYTGILDERDIWQNLIYDTPMKNDILQYLTLFHFSRFEKTTDISLKLDPYENIIGDDSVGALSLFAHMSGSAEFNSLAFLTEVRKVLNVAA